MISVKQQRVNLIKDLEDENGCKISEDNNNIINEMSLHKLSRFTEMFTDKNRHLSIDTLIILYVIFDDNIDKVKRFIEDNEIVAFTDKTAATYCEVNVDEEEYNDFVREFEEQLECGERMKCDKYDVINHFSDKVGLKHLDHQMYYVTR